MSDSNLKCNVCASGGEIQDGQCLVCGSSELSPAHGSVDTWRLHILGPDDLIPMESELHALREANMLNIGLARVRQKRPNDPNMPWCMAVVERNGVEYTSDQYPLNEKGQR